MKSRSHIFKNLGLIEVLFALYPILVAYQYGFFRFDVFILLLMDALVLAKKSILLKSKPLTLLTIFVLVHEIIWLFVTGGGQTQINDILSLIIMFGSVFIIVPSLNIIKLESSFKMVAIIVILGLAYHLFILAIGGSISPLRIPFLPDPGADSRFHDVYDNRPTSFFEEPAAAAVYLLVPFLFSLRKAQYLWSVILSVFVLLTTSTNGIVLLVVITIVYYLTQRIRFWSIALVVVAFLGLGYFYLTSSTFEVGREKLENTEFEQTSRLYNGPEIVFHMPSSDLILGMPFHTIEEYDKSGSLNGAILLETNKGSIFVSAIWLIIIKFGITGLIIFLVFYISIFKKGKHVWPYLTVVLVGMISSSTILNGGWTFQTILLIVFSSEWSSKSINSTKRGNIFC